MDPQLLALAGGGVIGGMVLLGRGFAGYREAARISDTSPSRIASIAVGEVLVSGVVEAGRADPRLAAPERAVRVLPGADRRAGRRRRNGRLPRGGGGRIPDPRRQRRASRVSARRPVRRPGPLRGANGCARGDAVRPPHPVGPGLRTGPGSRVPDRGAPDGPAGRRRAARRRRRPMAGLRLRPSRGRAARAELHRGTDRARRGRHGHRPGDALRSARGPRRRRTPTTRLCSLANDPEIAADLAAARAAGTLASDPEEAWGNAAIPGFGIGRPVREPELDDAATDLPLATPDDAARFKRTFEIAPDALILAASPDARSSSPSARRRSRPAARSASSSLGLLGAVVAIGSAMALALMLGGGLGG